MKAFCRLALLVAALSLLAAGGAMAQAPTMQEMGALIARPSETTIYVAREIITMDPQKPRAQAVAVRDGRFIAVGTRAEVEPAGYSSPPGKNPVHDELAVAAATAHDHDHGDGLCCACAMNRALSHAMAGVDRHQFPK